MRLPSGTILTTEDLAYLKTVLVPVKKKAAVGQVPCWYCGNGHDRQHVVCVHPYDMCECGASIIIWSRKTRAKALPHAKLAGEFASIIGNVRSKPKRMI